MNHMTSPCSDCPFLKKGGIRLRTARVRELVKNEGDFPCHKTVKRNGDGEWVKQHTASVCGGSLIFMDKIDQPNQMMRIAQQLGIYDPKQSKNRDLVFDSVAEMLSTCDDAKTQQRPADEEYEPCSVANADCLAPAGYSDGSEVAPGTKSAPYDCCECGDRVCANCSVELKRKRKKVRLCDYCAESE